MNTPNTIVDITRGEDSTDTVDILHMSDGSRLEVWNGNACYGSQDHAINALIGNQIVGTFINDDGSLTHIFNDVASEKRLNRLLSKAQSIKLEIENQIKFIQGIPDWTDDYDLELSHLDGLMQSFSEVSDSIEDPTACNVHRMQLAKK